MPKKPTSTFECDLDRLRAIVAALEEGPSTLDETLSLFEEGMKLAAKLETVLAAAETRVARLAQDGDGNLGVEDEEDAE